MKVRTIGTNRASTMARAPYLSKKATVLSTYSWRKNLESGRLKIAGPAARPIWYPTTLPKNAITVSTRQTNQSGCQMSPVPLSTPTVKSSESPGRKKPSSSPVSAKMIAAVPQSAQAPKALIILSGFSQPGPRLDARSASRCKVERITSTAYGGEPPAKAAGPGDRVATCQKPIFSRSETSVRVHAGGARPLPEDARAGPAGVPRPRPRSDARTGADPSDRAARGA